MSSEKVTPEKQSKIGFPHIPTPDEIANVVADKVITPVVDRVGQETSQDITNLMNNLKDTVKQIVDDALAQFVLPSVPTLNPLLNATAIDSVASSISSDVNLFDTATVKSLTKLSSTAGMESLSKQHLTTLLTAVDGLLDMLKTAADKTLAGIKLPTIDITKNSISSYNNFMDNIEDNIWELFKYSPELFDFTAINEKINSYTEELKNVTEDPEAMVSVLSVIELLMNCIADIFFLFARTFPLTLYLGANGGVAAGLNVTGSVRISGISIGGGIAGAVGTIFKCISGLCSTISTIIQQSNK